ncbi:hypothetical protein BDQ17DRAFT_1423580 [Cyathus striatus]|nr:hypothetical protein BDQ17DRAFT_1423580 [Cyathus striatus]
MLFLPSVHLLRSPFITLVPSFLCQSLPYRAGYFFSILEGEGSKQVKAHVCSPNSLWNVVDVQGGFDWAATPLLAVQELMKLAPMRPMPAVILAPHEHIGTVLTQDQIISLLDIFDSHYAPWLHIPPHRWGSSPQLDLVRCTVACRHLDPVTRNRVLPRLQKLTEEASLQHIFNPAPSQDYIESLLILSAWTPVGAPTSNEARMHDYFAQARTKLMNNELDEEGYRARLWQMLETAELLLCTGTGKPRLSRRIDPGNTKDIVIDASRLSSREGSSGLRIEICAKISELTEAGTLLHLEPDALLSFYSKSTDLLVKLDVPEEIWNPCQVSNYFSIESDYRLLVLHHIIQETRRVFGTDKQRPWYQVECRGTPVVICWTRDAVASAEAVFVSLLGAKDDSVLMTIPDCMFTLVAFAAAWLVISNFSMHELYKSHLGGSWDRLLAMAANRLSTVAPCPDHASSRCAHFISSLLGAWGQLTSRTQATSRKPMAGIPIQPMTVPFIPPGQAPASSFNATDWNPLYNSNWQTNPSNTFSDNDFWSTFMMNLSSGVRNSC